MAENCRATLCGPPAPLDPPALQSSANAENCQVRPWRPIIPNSAPISQMISQVYLVDKGPPIWYNRSIMIHSSPSSTTGPFPWGGALSTVPGLRKALSKRPSLRKPLQRGQPRASAERRTVDPHTGVPGRIRADQEWECLFLRKKCPRNKHYHTSSFPGDLVANDLTAYNMSCGRDLPRSPSWAQFSIASESYRV
jgi:hypothetical protein